MPLISLFIAFLAIGFLIFIHELGHYFVARRMGMIVETFGIGFGKALYSWKRNGVEWRLNWLPFGGYVKIKGMEISGKEDPYSIPNGFFTKSPLKRIMVAVAGPAVNIVFAILLFTIIWGTGGRTKPFSEYTQKIGWVDPSSELYAKGVRPGDEIHTYDGRDFREKKDHLYGPMTAGDTLTVEGSLIDYQKGNKEPFAVEVTPYPNPDLLSDEIMTSGVLASAGYVIYNPSIAKDLNITPRVVGGIQEGDRIVWLDGEQIFSHRQLAEVLNDGRILVTVNRGGRLIQARVPRVKVGDLKLSPSMKDEISDWQHEAQLVGHKLYDLAVIPYDLTPNGTVEKQLQFLDADEEEEAFSPTSTPLLPGDRVVAISGIPVSQAHQIFYQLQRKKMHLIVSRADMSGKPLQPQEEDLLFEKSVDPRALSQIVSSIGSQAPKKTAGNLVLLDPIVPIRQVDLYETEKEKADYKNAILERKKRIEEIESPELRERSLEALQREQQRVVLGLVGVQDKQVVSNPNPLQMSVETVSEMWHVLTSLFSGALSPKWMAGPVGMVQVVQKSWEMSAKDTLYWLGLISMNLGILNLLPIPVLDGGYILLFFFEWLTGKKIKPKALERLILPFVVLLVFFFLFVTFNDLWRIFMGI